MTSNPNDPNHPDHNQPRFGDFGSQPPPSPSGHHTQVVAPTRLSILAILSLVTGLLALPICCIPAGGSIFALLPVGLGFGGLRAIRKSQGRTAGKSLAIAGLVMGLLVTIASTLFWIAIGSQFAKMPAVYAQVLDKDPAVVRTILTSAVSTSITDEEITRFREAFIADYSQTWAVPAGLGPMLKGYLAAGDLQALNDVQPGPMQSPIPLAVEIDGGWTYLIVLIEQGETLGSGLPAVANAAYQAPDGSLVWLIDTPPPTPLDQSPLPDPADTESGTPDPAQPATDPNA
ncbi:hypothetical protein MNBD_PLANCTO03-2273 [hydrothermal vent metagenome]|uniref:DUF4190 domain-containing protein n=1 Tax=hydrothermal vent metagenome TaxID=652676 RepID=A0A3B1DZY7_9ZZZZ